LYHKFYQDFAFVRVMVAAEPWLPV